MVDTPESDKPEAKEDRSLDLDTDWGEDWAAAFQAEEHIFSSEDTEGDEFFLEETLAKEKTSGSDQGAQTRSGATQQTVGSSQTGVKAEAPVGQKSIVTIITALLSLPLVWWQEIREKTAGLSPLNRIALFGIPALIVLAVLAQLFFSGSKAPETAQAPFPGPLAQRAEEAPGSSTPTTSLPEAPAMETTKVLPPLPAGPVKDNVMKKWAFPSFVFPVVSAEGDRKTTFFFIDITLIAALEQDQDLPDEKRKFVRELIYQFYSNRPLYELRRFSLARGEMGRKLLAWLKKEWPDNPIASIQFDTYRMS